MSSHTHRHVGSGQRSWLRTPFLFVAICVATCLATTQVYGWEQCWTQRSSVEEAAAYDGSTHVAPIVWMLPILFLLFIYRRPAGTNANQLNDSTTPTGGGIASLSCSRCGRVLELPRDKAARQLFCPRCGSTLPRIR